MPGNPFTTPGAVQPAASQSFIGARVTLASDLAFVSPIPWNTIDFDSSGFWSAGVPERLTIPPGLGGKYLVGFNTDFGGPPSGWLAANIDASNKQDSIVGFVTNSSLITSGFVLDSCSGLWSLNAGDYVYVTFFAQNIGTGNFSGNDDTAFWISRLGS